MRNHRQRQEGELEKRLGQAAAEVAHQVAHGAEPFGHPRERLEAHQSRQRQRQFAEHGAIARRHEAAADGDQPVHRGGHVGVAVADHADIVTVVADRGGQRGPLQAEALDETAADIAVLAVAADHANLQHIVGRIGFAAAVAIGQSHV